jgi:asparagine synthase (glutamine-hydrolysing)
MIEVNSKDFLFDLKTMIQQHDGPVLTSSYYAHWLLVESISSHGYKIAVSGTAADELFSGYYEHHLAYLYEIRNDLELYEPALKAWNEYVKPLIRNPYLQDPDVFINTPDQRNYIYLNAEAFEKCLNFTWHESFSEKRFTNDLLRNRMLNEMFFEIVPPILNQDDLNSMYFSVENRSPFLDRSLFEFCNQIPSQYLIKDGFNKIILRDAMRDIIPENVINSRRKIGFNASINSLIDLKDPNIQSSLLNDSPIFEYVCKDKIEELMRKERMPNSESKFLFNFISSKIFLEKYLA